jgi:uncharacterized protein DUF6285
MTQDRPDGPDLLDAVAEFLIADVSRSVPPEQRFQVLVAAHLCAVVARERRAGTEPLLDDLLMFSRLLDQEPSTADDLDRAVREAEAELAKRLRSGALDERLPEVAASLREHVRRKLAIARPGYDAG